MEAKQSSPAAMRTAHVLIEHFGLDRTKFLQVEIANIVGGQTHLPELVEALKWITNICCGVSRSGGGIDPHDDEAEASIENAKKVLAKVGGE